MNTSTSNNRNKPFFVACYLVLINQNKVLLLRRYNTGYEDGNYSLVAGHVEPNETIKDALVREAKEEVGIDVFSNDLNFIRIIHRKSLDNRIYLDFFFRSECWTGQPSNREPSKCDKILWADLDNMPDNVIPHVRNVIEGMTDNNSQYCEVGWKVQD